MIKAIIIDDERNSRDIIALMLGKYCPQVDIADTASDCADGISKIKLHQPQLVFLDLEMPDGTGFDVLQGTQETPFEAVFVTAFEKKFLHAIRFSEVEIILKPIDKESLLQAVQTVTRRIEQQASKHRYRVLLDNFNHGKQTSWNLLLPLAGGQETTIHTTAIEYLESCTDKCAFYMDNGMVLYAERNFRHYADLLIPLRFYQVNNTQMVQLSHIHRVAQDSQHIQLNSGAQLEITERRKKDLLSFYNR
ncbi:LytR/AlgR family response regulator transcription factor [Chitinophaga japonensis]|uniref:LytTR family two component transcriptional regulator n=1 Tax=Chitinophaga japonensis TaxID=104662 RepID=A0A562TFD4_CHIJA|nr:response regulator [Chitinophaga japonensis]TWI91978.1 LytTR family two component transcriptional regulator [Chitinophaga japonensis]